MRILVAVVVLTACGPTGRDTPAADGPVAGDAGPDAPPPVDNSRIYAHSGQMLYRVNAQTFATTAIGPLTGVGTQSLTDLAIDKDDNVVGITLDKLFAIDASTGAATLIRDLSQSADGFTSLSYVPADPDDPASPDLLVTATDRGEVFQIDPATGTATLLGSYGTVALGTVRSSGDLFGIRGLGIYATVDIGDGTPGSEDYLARIDPVTWQATPIGAGTGFDKIFGVGYWGGRIYGFVDAGTTSGKVIEIDINTGEGTERAASDVRWFGAGVATDAPLL